MAAITESALWADDVYRIEENDPVEGGEAGVDNRPHKDLANRTLWLKQQQENEEVARANADMALAISIAAEATARANADTALQNQINALTLSIMNKAWPIGSVYENAVDDRNPAHSDLLGFGTWAVYAEGKTSVGLLGGDDDFGAIGQTGGKKGHKMTLPNLIRHDHDGGQIGASTGVAWSNLSSDRVPDGGKTSATGNEDPEPIPTLPPYIVSAKWRRIA